MQSPEHGIYHKEEPPPLARPDRQWRSAAGGLGLFGARTGSKSAVHPDHRMRRRRRSDMSPELALWNRITWLAVLLVAGVFIALVAFNEWRARGRRAAEAAPAQPAAVVETAPVESIATADEVPLADRMGAWNESLRLVEEGRLALVGGHAEEARAALERALEKTPHFAEAEVYLAQSLVRLKEHAQARALLVEALDKAPGDVSARLALAECLLALGRAEDALAVARWVIATDSYSPAAHSAAATALVQLERPAESVVHLRRLVSLNRDDLSAQNSLGLAFLKMKDFRNAQLTFREIIRADPDHSVAYYNLAIGFAQQNDAAGVVDVLGKAVEKFGREFVQTWVQAADFDPVRTSPVFEAFQAGSGILPVREKPTAALDAAPAAGS